MGQPSSTETHFFGSKRPAYRVETEAYFVRCAALRGRYRLRGIYDERPAGSQNMECAVLAHPIVRCRKFGGKKLFTGAS